MYERSSGVGPGLAVACDSLRFCLQKLVAASLFTLALAACRQAPALLDSSCERPLTVLGLESPRAPGYRIVYRATATNALRVASNLEERYGFSAGSIRPGDGVGRAVRVPLVPGSDAFVVESASYRGASSLFAEGVSDEVLQALRCDRRILEIAANNLILLED